MAPPPPSIGCRFAVLSLRALTFVSLLVSLVVLITNSVDLETGPGGLLTTKLRFNDVYAYRYLLAATVIGIAYTLLQIAFSLFNISTGNRAISGDKSFTFDFYADKVASYLLATGAAAAFAVTRELKASGTSGDVNKFLDKGYACASLVLVGFVCTAILSVFSSYALPKTA